MSTVTVRNANPAFRSAPDNYYYYNLLKSDSRILVNTDSGPVLSLSCYDLSREGMNLQCSYEEALAINPDGLSVSRDNPRLVGIEFELPVDMLKVKLTIVCEVLYVALLPDSADDAKFIVGLKFKKFSGNAGNFLIRYFENQVNSATSSNA